MHGHTMYFIRLQSCTRVVLRYPVLFTGTDKITGIVDLVFVSVHTSVLLPRNGYKGGSTNMLLPNTRTESIQSQKSGYLQVNISRLFF